MRKSEGFVRFKNDQEGFLIQRIETRNWNQGFFIAGIIFMFFIAPAELYSSKRLEAATFAGGCFWCIECAFQKLPGVIKATSGYMKGSGCLPEKKDGPPTYRNYASQGYVEAVQVSYDSSQISYSELLDHFWREIDPTDAGGQFADRGPEYRTVIFFHNAVQEREAIKSKMSMDRSGRYPKRILTEILKASEFYKAEEHHQNFCRLNPGLYRSYHAASGREGYLAKIWGGGEKESAKPRRSRLFEEKIKKKLTPLQCDVTQKGATEKPFKNAYWDYHEEGIYVDIVSGEPLFGSTDKFDSETGWPSFIKPLEPENIIEKEDRSLPMPRVEVRSKYANSHLGHVFPDGPKPMGLRFCINSSALRFIPKKNLEKEGYGQYQKLFYGENPKESLKMKIKGRKK